MINFYCKNRFFYLFFMTSASLLGFSKFIIYAKVISVQEFGLYSLVLSSYIFFVFFGGMGLQEGLLKKGSMFFASRDEDSIKAYFLRSIRFSILIAGSAAVVAIIIVSMIFHDNYEVIEIFGLGIILALATILFNLLDSFIRSQQKFVLFSFILTIKNIISITLGYSLADDYGAKGLIFSEIISILMIFFVTSFFLIRRRDIKLYKQKRIRKLIGSGYQMMLTLVLRNAALMLDRWFIALAVGVTALGYYSFSMILLTISMILVSFLVTIKGPQWISSFKTHNDIKNLIHNVNATILRALALLAFISPLFLLNIEKILILFYPEYAEDTVFYIISIIYLSLFVVIPIYLYDWVFIATSQEGLLIKINIWATLLSALLYAISWFLEASIVVYAVVFLITRALLFIGYFYRIRIMYVF